MPDPTDNGDHDSHRQPVGTIQLTTIGTFTEAAQPANHWTVTWNPATHEVTATRTTRARSSATVDIVKTLARLPTVGYIDDLLDIIKRARAATATTEHTVTFDDLSHWLTRLDRALADTTTAITLADTIIDDDAFYLDYGHSCGTFDPNDHNYTAPELWHDLADNAAQARDQLQRLATELHDNGNLASAAAEAKELATTAIAMHIALQAAYSTTHWATPGPPSKR